MTATKATAKRSQLISIAEAAERLDCSRGHVYNLAAAGHFRLVEIKATGPRSKTRLYEADLEDFITRQTRVAG